MVVEVASLDDVPRPIRVEQARALPAGAAQAVEGCLDVQDEFPELRGPAGCLPGPGHDAAMVVDGLEECGLEGRGHLEHAAAAVAEPAGTVRADMREGRHQEGGTRAGDAPGRGDEVERADGLHQAWVGLLLSRDQQVPALGIGVVPRTGRRAGRGCG